MEARGARGVAAPWPPGAFGGGGGPQRLLAQQLAPALQGAGDPMAPVARGGAPGPLRQPRRLKSFRQKDLKGLKRT